MDIKKPRPHHHALGHIVLRAACTRNPAKFAGLMTNKEKVIPFISTVWDDVLRLCEKYGETDIKISELSVTPLMINDHPSLFIGMPRVKTLGEALYIAIVFTEDKEEMAKIEKPSFRFFALEFGVYNNQDTRTFLCEWVDDKYVNHRMGCAPKTVDFCKLVERKLQSEAAAAEATA